MELDAEPRLSEEKKSWLRHEVSLAVWEEVVHLSDWLMFEEEERSASPLLDTWLKGRGLTYIQGFDGELVPAVAGYYEYGLMESGQALEQFAARYPEARHAVYDESLAELAKRLKREDSLPRAEVGPMISPFTPDSCY